MIEANLITWSRISILKLIKNAHFIFLSGVMGFMSGVLLLKGKKCGWILNVSSWLVYSLGAFLITWRLERTNDSFTNQNYILIGILIFIFLIMAIVMILKPFRLKYKPSSKSWATIGVITLVFLLDKLLIK